MAHKVLSLIAATALFATPALAQRDPAYAAARAAGQVGEQGDGYLGVVSGGADVRAIVSNINIQRKAAYTRSAAEQGVAVDQFAFTSGCNLVQQTKPGEKYRAPDGSWQTRGAGAPTRDSRCV